MRDYRKLDVYQKSMEYVVGIYKFSERLPKDERYGLMSQIRRASVSIPLNISEGASCGSDKESAKFLWYSYGSAKEVVTCLELCEKLGMCKPEKVKGLIEEGDRICAMLYNFIQRISEEIK